VTVVLLVVAVLVAIAVAVLVARYIARPRFAVPGHWPYCIFDGEPLYRLDGGWSECRACGFTYADALFVDVERADWHDIARRGLACRECEPALAGVPRVHVRDGRPVRCPEHEKVSP